MKMTVLMLASVLASPLAGAQIDRPALRNYIAAREQQDYVISVSEAAKSIRSEHPTILDLRTGEAFDQNHIEQSVHVPFRELLTTPEPQFPTDAKVLIVDEGGSTAVEAMVLLRIGGYNAWAVQGGEPALAAALEKPNQVSSSPSTVAGSFKTQEGTQREAKPSDIPPYVWIILAIAGVGVGGIALYFLVLLPRRRIAPLREAERILNEQSQPDWRAVEDLLEQGVTAGLRPPDLADCRFLLAYVRTRQSRYQQALSAIEELIASGNAAGEAMYLDLWLKVKEKQYDQAEERIEKSWDAIAGLPESNLLAGIVFLQLGRLALSQAKIDRAVAYFERVRKLGVLSDRIPKDLDDQEMAIAIQTLVQGKREEAQKRFEQALYNAKSRGGSTIYPEIGLLLCRWKGEEIPQIDAELGKVAQEIIAQKTRFQTQLVSHVLLWHAVSVLFTWLRLPEKRGLPQSERARLEERLERLGHENSVLPEPDFVAGLVDYYFASDDAARGKAIERLKAAMAAGLCLPDVTLLVQAEERLASVARERDKHYMTLLRAYLGDPTVPVELKRSLREHLRGFERYRDLLEGVEVEVSPGAAFASIQDLAASCEMIEGRVRHIFQGMKGGRDVDGVQELLESLAKSRTQVTSAAEELNKTEAELMRVAGEALLSEELAKTTKAKGGA